jgi:hypothetical protein
MKQQNDEVRSGRIRTAFLELERRHPSARRDWGFGIGLLSADKDLSSNPAMRGRTDPCLLDALATQTAASFREREDEIHEQR